MKSGNGKFNLSEKIEGMKRTLEGFEKEIYNYTYERDIRTSCYGALIDNLDYFVSILTILKSKNRKRWSGKAAKQVYVTMISIIEYAMDKIVEKYPRSPLYRKVQECKKNNGFSLRKLVYLSADLGLLNRTLKRDFENIIEIRNLLVHNNAISNRTGVMMIGDVTIKMTKGDQIPIKLPELLEIILTALEIFHRWNVDLAKNYGIAKRW
ncbi:MAG: hypothetical protein XD48_0081 [Archaeoglobus fulgidus]|jgi:hypothetical protein|uniref:RiboL-PSP-HEPN domain-containing protein n=1 Tax=Archaeoglobus fulgidus TaxID=2234 RepID=A0A117KV74_ARCFL|nr:MAG: hypothetical protein XD48_0081 [Archaeoglobus fulgidus]